MKRILFFACALVSFSGFSAEKDKAIKKFPCFKYDGKLVGKFAGANADETCRSEALFAKSYRFFSEVLETERPQFNCRTIDDKRVCDNCNLSPYCASDRIDLLVEKMNSFEGAKCNAFVGPHSSGQSTGSYIILSDSCKAIAKERLPCPEGTIARNLDENHAVLCVKGPRGPRVKPVGMAR